MPDWDIFFPPSRPRRTKDGIRARSRRGFGASWWARRWIASLERLGMGSRLQRGASYARGGQVVALEIEAGAATARVQGSRRTPYDVRVALAPFPDARARRAAAILAKRPGLVARLLGGEMPEEVEEVLAAEGLALMPVRAGDLVTSCSCPDWANPCKHVAAVHYLIAEELDRDAFLVFELRGMSRERLLELLARGGAARGARRRPAPPAPPAEEVALPVEPARFWGGDATPGAAPPEPPPPGTPPALLRRLGPFPLWRSDRDLLATLTPIHDEAARLALRLLDGETLPEEAPATAGGGTDRNAYCRELGLPVPPRLADLVGRRGISILELATFALLEHGGPMARSELTERLRAAGVPGSSDDVADRLRRVWRWRRPLRLDEEDRFTLDLRSKELAAIVAKLVP